MKTETKIAKENVKRWKFTKPEDGELWRLNIGFNKSQEHKQTCQRWLEKAKEDKDSFELLRKLIKVAKGDLWGGKVMPKENEECFNEVVKDIEAEESRKDKEIKDLKQAILTYKEEGI